MVLLGWLVSASGAIAASWTPGVEVTRPADAKLHSNALVPAVSCAAAGDCSAVGSYHDGSGHGEAMLLSESAGVWGAAIRAKLPADAGANPEAGLNSISCPAVGDCTAVGGYTDNSVSGREEGLLVTETAGAWKTGVKALLPADAATNPKVGLRSVSCSSAGNCSAVGEYTDGSGHPQGLLLTETAGKWTGVEEATLPPDRATSGALGPNVSVESVSCASPGECSAVGSYVDNAGHKQGLLLSESGGFWDLGEKATLPADHATDPAVELASVSCVSVGNCSAVGSYSDNGAPSNEQGVLLTETAGGWLPGEKALLPAGGIGAILLSVSCVTTGSCSAVGNYVDASQGRGLLLDKAGTWRTGIPAVAPNAGTESGANLYSVSCPAVGDCGAVGSYVDKLGRGQGVLLTETGGAWANADEAMPPANAGTDPGVYPEMVSCASVGNCSAVGEYTNKAGDTVGLLLGTLRGLTVLKAGRGHGSVTSSPAGIHCGAACSHGFASGRVVTLTVKPARGSWFTGWSGACSGRHACRVSMTAERAVTAHFALLPNTKITEAKIDAAHQRATFKFKSRGKATGFQCALVRAKKHRKPKPHFSHCRSPRTYKSLAPGRYTFLVRAVNAGGPDPTPANKKFRL